jgi:hypothetical protein
VQPNRITVGIPHDGDLAVLEIVGFRRLAAAARELRAKSGEVVDFESKRLGRAGFADLLEVADAEGLAVDVELGPIAGFHVRLFEA